MLLVFIYAYWYPTRFPYQKMHRFTVFIIKTAGVTSGAGSKDPSDHTNSPLVFSVDIVAQSLVYSRSEPKSGRDKICRVDRTVGTCLKTATTSVYIFYMGGGFRTGTKWL